jgi:hypothetical protein
MYTNGDCGRYRDHSVRSLQQMRKETHQAVYKHYADEGNCHYRIRLSEVWLPPFTVPIECDEDFPTLQMVTQHQRLLVTHLYSQQAVSLT